MSQALFEPITLRGVTVRNRLWVPPMCQYSVPKEDGVATNWHTVHYGSLARGGAGAIIIEAAAVEPEGRISARDLGIWNDEQRDALAPIATFAQSQGAAIGIQLAHAGRKANVEPEWGTPNPGQPVPEDQGGWETFGPSNIPFEGFPAPTVLDEDGIDRVVHAFAAAAQRAHQAGLDFVEVHAAHGYLVHEFLSPLSNHRVDEYGGTLENRARLLIRIVDEIRKSVPESMPVLVRLSATEWTEGGFDVDEAAQVVSWLGKLGVDLVDVSSGGNVRASIPVGPGYQTPAATAIKQATTVPVGAVGMIDEPWQAEQIVATGLADVVLSGREFLRDPAFGIHAATALGVDPSAVVPPAYARAYRQAGGQR